MFIIIIAGMFLFIVTMINPFFVLPIFVAGSYTEPLQFFPQFVQYNPTMTLGIIVLAAYILHVCSAKDFINPKSGQIKFMIFFIIWMGVSSIVHGGFSFEMFKIILTRSFLPYFLFICIIQSKKQLKIITWIFLLLGVITAVYGIYQFKFNLGIYDRGVRRIVSFFDNPNALGISLALLIPFAMGLLVYGKYKARVRALILGFLAILTAGVVISYSRSGFIGFIAAIFLFVALFFKGEKKIVAGVITVICLLIAIDFFPSHAKYTMWGRLRTITRADSAEELDAGRAETGKAGIKMMMENPLFGVGLGRFRGTYINMAATSDDVKVVSEHALVAHNLYVQVGSQIGLVGLFLYLLFILSVFRDLRAAKISSLRRKDTFITTIVVCIQTSVIVFLLCGFMSGILLNKSIWMIFPVSAALKKINDHEEELSQNSKFPSNKKKPWK
ncbi:MAG: O-antigen ligase family protein [Candidatus Omnitrophica bacterium]|nr:O-antigen ligase family protein [Candidatus Omnitrophota bacterium]